jgi:hypothetical protein
MARPERFELPTLWFEARCSIQLSYGRVPPCYQKLRATAGYGNANEGNSEIAEGGRKMVGLGRLELPTSPLSGVRSSHLSYRPNLLAGNILRDLRRSSNNGSASVAQLAGVIQSASVRDGVQSRREK